MSYSENRISDATPAFIIGQVKDNIIMWYKGAENYKRSVILVYDKKLKLITKETTDILHSDIDPVATFYNSIDSFYVAYQYQNGNKREYKLAGFDYNGHLSSTYIIDSAVNLNNEDSASYSFYQSSDKKILACVKNSIDKQNSALRFEFTFLNGGNLYRDHLLLGLDAAREQIADISIDNNKNITFLNTSHTDSGFVIAVLKKAFAVPDLSIATKRLSAGNLLNGTIHLFSKLNNYTVYGVWENAVHDSITNHQQYKTGLYIWKLNAALADMPGDTIQYDDYTTLSAVSLYANNATGDNSDDFFGVETDSIHIPGPHAFKPHRELYFQVIADGKTGYYNYIADTFAKKTSQHYKAGFTVLSINNQNKIIWRNELDHEQDSLLLTDLSSNRIVAGKKGIHIVRSTTGEKRRNTIEHILITYTGRYEKKNTVAWSNKYTYLLSYAVVTNDGALIIPCVKEGKVIFAKMMLE